MVNDREDVSAQRAAVARARTDLGAALALLGAESKRAQKAAESKRGTPDLPAVYAALNGVLRAEEDLDTATYDLHTAAGGHG
jgi:hypothetical protein